MKAIDTFLFHMLQSGLECSGNWFYLRHDLVNRSSAIENLFMPMSGSAKVCPAITNFLRYPGSKRRLLAYLGKYLPPSSTIVGRYVEPFVGSGAVFLYLHPRKAILSDINKELIDLYRGVRLDPRQVWQIYSTFGRTKRDYWQIRSASLPAPLSVRAARTLYLNRTCFKGMWRHNRYGEFNVGYGGQSRRWVIGEETLVEIGRRLRRAKITCDDFEGIIDDTGPGDFLFLDPPYRPGFKELTNDHYAFRQFTFEDHRRLAAALRRAQRRGACWAMTTSSHPDVAALFKGNRLISLPRGTGAMPGQLVVDSGEILVLSYAMKGTVVL